MKFLISTENIENKILLFPVLDSFEKIFSLKMFSKIQPNAFSLLFSIFSKNKNRKQSNQTFMNFLVILFHKTILNKIHLLANVEHRICVKGSDWTEVVSSLV